MVAFGCTWALIHNPVNLVTRALKSQLLNCLHREASELQSTIASKVSKLKTGCCIATVMSCEHATIRRAVVNTYANI